MCGFVLLLLLFAVLGAEGLREWAVILLVTGVLIVVGGVVLLGALVGLSYVLS